VASEAEEVQKHQAEKSRVEQEQRRVMEAQQRRIAELERQAAQKAAETLRTTCAGAAPPPVPASLPTSLLPLAPVAPVARAAPAPRLELKGPLSADNAEHVAYCRAALKAVRDKPQQEAWKQELAELVLARNEATKVVTLYVYLVHGGVSNKRTKLPSCFRGARRQMEKMAAVLPHMHSNAACSRWLLDAGSLGKPNSKQLELFQIFCGYSWSADAVRRKMSY